jgi:hypothetical protein
MMSPLKQFAKIAACRRNRRRARDWNLGHFFVARELARLTLKPLVMDAQEVTRNGQRPEQKSNIRDAPEWCEGLRRGF